MWEFESDDFIEMDPEKVVALRRSTSRQTFKVSRGINYELLAFLVVQQEGSEKPIARIALFSQGVKRGLVFRATEGEGVDELLAAGEQVMKDLGYDIEEVNLKFSAAMRQTVLASVPALKTASTLKTFRDERRGKLKELEEIAGSDPVEDAKDSYGWTAEAVKTATLDLQKIQNQNENFLKLSRILSGKFSSAGLTPEELLERHVTTQQELQDLSDELEELRSFRDENTKLQDQLDKQLATVEQLKEEIRQAKEAAGENAAKDLEKLQESLQQVEKERDKLQGELKETGKESASLQKEVSNLKEELENARGGQKELKGAEKELANALDTIEKLKTESADLTAELNQQRELNASAQAEVETAQKELVELQETVKTSQAEAEGAHKETEKLARQLEKIATQNEASDKKQDSLVGEIETLKGDLKQRSKDVAVAQSAREKAEQELAGQAEELGSLREQLKQSQLRQKDVTDRIRKGKEEAEQSTEDLEEELASVQEALSKSWKQRDTLKERLAEAQDRIDKLESSGGQQAAAPGSSEDKEGAGSSGRLQKQLDSLTREKVAVDTELDEARKSIERLEKELSTAVKSEVGSAGADENVEKVKDVQKQLAALESELIQEREGRENAEKRLHQQQSENKELEQSVADLEKNLASAKEESLGESPAGEDGSKTRDLQKKLAKAETALEEERRDRKNAEQDARDYRTEIRDLKQKIDELEQGGGDGGLAGKEEPARKGKSASTPPPHEVRRPPAKGATFMVDWDLESLPCSDVDAIGQAWVSAYNVNLSLEGYEAQYCTALLVVVQKGSSKGIHLLFNLKSEKRNLVLVPVKAPKDTDGLKKAVAEAKRYLQLSGFEMDKVAAGDMASKLGAYLKQ